MESRRFLQTSIICVIVSVTPSSASQNFHRIQGLDCFNDFDETIVCFWKVVDSSSDCTKDFTLSYTDISYSAMTSDSRCDAVENGDIDLRHKCVFNINVKAITIFDKYKILILSQGETVGQTSLSVRCKVKPKPPMNVRVKHSEEENALVLWDVSYKSHFLKDKLSFNVQIHSKKDRTMVLEKNVSDPWFPFSKRELSRGHDYSVRVRAKPSEAPKYDLKGTWSEWSPEAEWRNDYALTPSDVASSVIPVCCLLVLVLSISSYYFIVRWKKQGWDNIPDPAKSSLSTVIQNQHGTPNETSKSAKPWRSCLKNFSKARGKPERDQKRQNIRENATLEKYTFEPENELVVLSFELCSKEEEDGTFSIREVISENESAAHLPSRDSSICSMFRDILDDSSTPEMGAFENLTTGTILWGFQTQETRLPSSEILPEVGCPSHRSDGCSVEDLRKVDWTDCPYKEDSPSCVPSVSRGTVRMGCTFMNFSYSTSASAKET